jgi:hypothetical protein
VRLVAQEEDFFVPGRTPAEDLRAIEGDFSTSSRAGDSDDGEAAVAGDDLGDAGDAEAAVESVDVGEGFHKSRGQGTGIREQNTGAE